MFYQLEHIGSSEYITVEQNKNFSYPPHIHQCFEVILIRSGSMNVTVDNKLYSLKSGEAALIFPNQVHSLESNESEHILCIFSPELVKTFSRKRSESLPESNKFNLAGFSAFFEQLSQNKDEIFCKGVLYLICSEFDNSAIYKKQQSDKNHLLHRIFEFVDKHFEDNCSVTALAEEIGYNYSYLSRYFKKIVGISFNNYVNIYRLNHACYLLRSSASPIIKCAYESGFVSLRSFNRNFKERFGITPIEYRNLSKKGL